MWLCSRQYLRCRTKWLAYNQASVVIPASDITSTRIATLGPLGKSPKTEVETPHLGLDSQSTQHSRSQAWKLGQWAKLGRQKTDSYQIGVMTMHVLPMSGPPQPLEFSPSAPLHAPSQIRVTSWRQQYQTTPSGCVYRKINCSIQRQQPVFNLMDNRWTSENWTKPKTLTKNRCTKDYMLLLHD